MAAGCAPAIGSPGEAREQLLKRVVRRWNRQDIPRETDEGQRVTPPFENQAFTVVTCQLRVNRDLSPTDILPEHE